LKISDSFDIFENIAIFTNLLAANVHIHGDWHHTARIRGSRVQIHFHNQLRHRFVTLCN